LKADCYGPLYEVVGEQVPVENLNR
jgi:hypothetical protein